MSKAAVVILLISSHYILGLSSQVLTSSEPLVKAKKSHQIALQVQNSSPSHSSMLQTEKASKSKEDEEDTLDGDDYQETLLRNKQNQMEWSEVDAMLTLVNSMLLYTFEADVRANDVGEEIKDMVDDHWDDDFKDAGEDIARYGGVKAANIYYVLISIDIDEFTILYAEAKGSLSKIKRGMDVFYKGLAKEEEEEDEDIHDQNLLELVTKSSEADDSSDEADEETDDDELTSDEYYEKLALELNDLLIEAVDQILLVNPDCNDLIYEADQLIEEKFDDDKEHAAMALFFKDRERTDWLYMEFVKLDLDSIMFVTETNREFMNQIFFKLQSLYDETEAERYHDLIQTKSKTSLHSKSKDSEAESGEEDDVAAELAEKVLDILDKVNVANQFVNEEIDEMEYYVREWYDGDYSEAAEDIIEYVQSKAADIFVAFNTLDIDECTFLSKGRRHELNQMYNGMRDEYSDMCDDYTF